MSIYVDIYKYLKWSYTTCGDNVHSKAIRNIYSYIRR